MSMEGGNRGQVAWHRGNVTPSKPPPLNTPIMLIMCFGTWLVFVFAFLGVVASSTSSPRVCLFVCLFILFICFCAKLFVVACSLFLCYLLFECLLLFPVIFLLVSCFCRGKPRILIVQISRITLFAVGYCRFQDPKGVI